MSMLVTVNLNLTQWHQITHCTKLICYQNTSTSISSFCQSRDQRIENSNGALKTSVYDKEAAESYVVPFGSDHSDHVFRNTVDTAVTRAVRYSTTLSQFEEEKRQMKLMFLYNGYPPRHIDRRVTKLFMTLAIYVISY
ncbi:unnamed protein product [Rotaria magnacalcarata]|uniref:Helix-turn-helix domain-containing protein n=1 Tax=Rotaria magnacalcarata TaxID=392030 RepID=A0A8S3C4H4_9BILA|nr:unnamed protein product [Rotaria magnacalcarata]